MSIYSCGCTKNNVPILSECEEHGGHVVSAAKVMPPSSRRAFMTLDKSTVLFYADVKSGMSKLKDKTVGLILSYPDHFYMYVRQLLDPESFTRFPDFYFSECFRVLKNDGLVVLVVEPNALCSVLYCAHFAGFNLVSQELSKLALRHPNQFFKASYYHRFVLVFSKQQRDVEIRSRTMQELAKTALASHTSGLIVDTSCNHQPFLLRGRKRARTIGIVSVESQFESIKKTLKEGIKQ